MHKSLILPVLAALLLLLPVPGILAEDNAELSYKRWENEILYPSFDVYLKGSAAARDGLLKRTEQQGEGLEAEVVAYATGTAGEGLSPAMPLNLREAMEVAISSNREVQSALLKPGIAEADREIAESVYDPVFFSDSRYYDTDRPIQSVLDNGTDGSSGRSSLLERGWSTSTGVRKMLATGGSAIVAYEADNLSNNSELTIPNPQYTSRLRLELHQSLLKERGDRSNRTNIMLAEIVSDQSEAEYKKSLSNVLEEMALYYWRYKYYFQLAEIGRAAVAAGEEILTRIETRQEQGIDHLLDLDRAASALSDRRVQLVADRKLQKTTLNQLKVILGVSPVSRAFRLEITPTEPFLHQAPVPRWDSVLEMALNRRYEIAIARKQINAADIKVDLAEHLQLPTVDARTSVTFNGLGDEYVEGLGDSLSEGQLSWDVGLVIEWPIGNRKGQLEAQKSHLARRRAQIQWKQVLEKIAYEVNSSYSDVELSAAEVAASLEARDGYRQVLEREEALFALSRATNQQLMDAQDEFYDAERAHVRALFNFNVSLLRLQWAQGILLETFQIDS